MMITWVPVDEALASEEPAILISADGWKYDSVTLPVSSRDRSLTLVGLGKDDAETTLTLNKDIRFGSLQTVFDGRRSLLVATSNGAPAQLDDLLRRLSSDPRGWSALRGSAVVAIEGSEPQMVPDRTPVSVYGPAPSESQTGDQDQGHPGVSTTWIAVAVFAAIGIGAVAYWMGRRRRRPAPPEPPTTPPSDP